MRTLSIIAMLAGCQKETADEGWTCQDTPTAIEMSEVSALGFTAEALVANVAATEAATFTYIDGTATALSLGFVSSGIARFVDGEPAYLGDGDEFPLIDIDCFDRVEVAGTLTFATDDGAFDETFDVAMSGATAEEASVALALDLAALGGTFDLGPFIDTEDPWDTSSAWLGARFAGGVSAGSVDGQISGTEEGCVDGDTCSAWAAQVPVGTWGNVAE
jgi:hypothetical protein